MKKKNIFLTILCALCIISSCIVTSFYPNVSTATPTKLPETLEQNLTAFILAKKLEQDPKYEYITFEKDTPEDIQKDNFGASIRTCAAVGVKSIIIPKDRSVGVTDVVVKTSVGTINYVKIIMVNNLVATIKSLQNNLM